WKNSWILWEHAIAANPDNWYAHQSLGSLYAEERHDVDSAIRQYRLAVKCNPLDKKSYAHLGQLLHHSGKLDEVIALWKEALQVNPGEASWHHNLGQTLINAGKSDEGIAELYEAIRLGSDPNRRRSAEEPDLAGTHLMLSQELTKRGAKEKA